MSTKTNEQPQRNGRLEHVVCQQSQNGLFGEGKADRITNANQENNACLSASQDHNDYNDSENIETTNAMPCTHASSSETLFPKTPYR